MKFKPVKLAPTLITTGVIALVCLVRLLRWDFLERLERITYDQRVRAARHFPKPVATNLGAVFITDDSIKQLNNGSLGFRYGLYWPRHIYGRLIQELADEGATAVAFDILLSEPRLDHRSVPEISDKQPDMIEFLTSLHPGEETSSFEDGGKKIFLVQSDDYLAWQLKRTGRAIIAAQDGVLPIPLFATNAWMQADISAFRDDDGVLRRAKAFRDYHQWDSEIVSAAADTLIDLTSSKITSREIQFLTKTGKPILDDNDNALRLQLNDKGEFDIRPYLRGPLSPGESPWRKPFAIRRVWHMGIVLAARQLHLNLDDAQVDLEHGKITLRAGDGSAKVLPVDREGFLYINWELPINDPRVTLEPVEALLQRHFDRTDGKLSDEPDTWKGKLVVVGSSATGNDLSDRGATPLEKDTFLVSKHWNVANSVLTGRFVRHASTSMELLLIVLLGALTAFATWQFRVFSAAGGVVLLGVAYIGVAFFLYIQYRYWLPIVLPLVGAVLVEHISLVTYRVVFEQAARRRIKSMFSQVVSPNIVNVLLDAESLSFDGARQEVTVFFADVRGFTELTDTNQEKAAAFVRDRKLTDAAARDYFDEEARETLNTVNLYLALVADMVKKHDGTLDKYIGDCVMAFWGAPTPNAKHALACVQAAIDAQRAIYEVNQRRAVESQKLEIENRARVSVGLTPKPLLPTLALGTGINTGQVTVGLMGSEAHIRNYTVFGREVNLASRLEGVSGHGRIVIGETTYQHLLRDDPALAARCIELEPTKPKGFKNPVKNYEVPWLPPGAQKENSGNAATETVSTR